MSTTRATSAMTIPHIQGMRERGERIAMIAAYDYPGARLADEAEIDIVLVGDSLAMTVLGYTNTLAVTMAEMLIFTAAVSRACRRAMVIGDMPFGSYTVSNDEAIRNGLRFMKEAGAHAIKLEGGVTVANTVRHLVGAGIPVMGHIGLTPQSVALWGGFRVQGRTAAGVRQLLDDCRAIEDAGAFALVVEAVPAVVGRAVTEAVAIPTIGIGAGPHCSGQVLVWHDLVGLYHERPPRFARRYADAGTAIKAGLMAYAADVRAGRFPDESHTFSIPEEERAAVESVVAEFRDRRSGTPGRSTRAMVEVVGHDQE